MTKTFCDVCGDETDFEIGRVEAFQWHAPNGTVIQVNIGFSAKNAYTKDKEHLCVKCRKVAFDAMMESVNQNPTFKQPNTEGIDRPVTG